MFMVKCRMWFKVRLILNFFMLVYLFVLVMMVFVLGFSFFILMIRFLEFLFNMSIFMRVDFVVGILGRIILGLGVGVGVGEMLVLMVVVVVRRSIVKMKRVLVMVVDKRCEINVVGRE